MNTMKNKVQLIGNLGMDPEVKQTAGNKFVAKMSLATTEFYKDSEGNKAKSTQWHSLVAWGPMASLAEKLLKKGNEIAVEGKLSHRVYEAKDGTKRYVTEVVVNEILLLNSSKQAA